MLGIGMAASVETSSKRKMWTTNVFPANSTPSGSSSRHGANTCDHCPPSREAATRGYAPGRMILRICCKCCAGARRPERFRRASFLASHSPRRYNTLSCPRFARGPAMAQMTFVKGANQGTTMEMVGERIVIGRNADCNIVLNVPAVSREHAVIHKKQGKYYIEDMKSRNGTFVNSKEVSARTQLHDADKIKICDNLMPLYEHPPIK